MRTITLGLSLLFGGTGGLWAAHTSPALVQPLSSAQPTPGQAEPGILCNGEAYALEVSLEPVATRRVGTADVLDVDLVVSQRTGRAVSLAYAVELLDDRGEPVEPVRESPRLELASNATPHSLRLSTPTTLRDGFYVLRSTVAGFAGTEELSEFRHLYVEVRRGQAMPIDFDRWVTHSQASQMRSAR
ncbi:hypothetical protein ACLESO_17265 [Pyxidicoccus sp. 3LG]